jgi:hypothetical protein
MSMSSSDAFSPKKTESPRGRTFQRLSPLELGETDCKSSKIARSLSLGRLPTSHDTLFNYIPGSCFEIGASIAILRNPGVAGVAINNLSKKISNLLRAAANPIIGDSLIFLRGKRITLSKAIEQNILTHLHPSSDQVGRCLERQNTLLKEHWFNGSGLEWLIKVLNSDHDKDDQTNIENMLTKIRVISGFGDIMEAIPHSFEILSNWLGIGESELVDRYSELKTKIDHENFNNPATRARAEKAPIIGGKSVTDLSPKVTHQDALKHHLGFGEVYVNESFDESLAFVAKLHEEEILLKGRQGMKRQGQVISDPSRPGIITDYAFDHMPDAFRELNLDVELSLIRYEHGTGINRWQLKGSYPRQSWEYDLPAAGAHSGGTRNVFLATNALSDKSVFGNKETAYHVGMMTAAFMNFGGYHTFVETLPIAEAVGNNETFVVAVDEERKKTLYRNFLETSKASSEIAGDRISELEKAYKASS